MADLIEDRLDAMIEPWSSAVRELRERRTRIADLGQQLSEATLRLEAMRSELTSLSTRVGELEAAMPNVATYGVSQDGVAAFEAAGVPVGAVRIYRRAEPPPWPQLDAAVRTGRLPIVSIKPGDWTAMATGATDGYLRTVSSYLAQVGRVDLILHHEPEDDGDPQAWRAAMVRAISVLRAQLPPQVRVGICLMAWTWQPASGRRVEDWILPVDFLAVDGYNDCGCRSSGGVASSTGTWRAPEEIFGPPLATAASMGVPLLIAEVGCARDPQDGSRRALWIEELGHLVRRERRIEAVCWYERAVGGPSACDWRISTDERAISAWRRVVG